MKPGKLHSMTGRQRGFTLIEMLAVLAITSLIGVGAATATAQIFTQGTRNSDYTTASRHTTNAIHWISRDAQMCQTVTPGEGSGFPLTLSWTGWDNAEYEVTYTITGSSLRRSYSVNEGTPMETVIAEYINATAENTTCGFASDNVLMLKVTATVGSGQKAISVSKVRGIVPRPTL